MASLDPLQGVLGRRRAAHLLRRTSFRYTRQRVDELAGLTASAALDLLFAPAPLQLEQPLFAATPAATPVTWINPPKPPSTPLPADDTDLRPYVAAWWVNEALHDPGIGHKMAFFFHQFLAVDIESGSSMAFFDYLALLRWGSLGNFKKLVLKMVVDNCMLTYIDNDQNFAQNPNENFAREFLELHTIGKGEPAGPGDYTTFTEDDVVQAARVFTGYNHARRDLNTDLETGIPAGKAYPQSHDFDPKTFSPRFGGQTIQAPMPHDVAAMQAELNVFTDMVFAQPETARNLCRRLYRYFLTRNISPEVENDVIVPLAQTLVSNGFEIKPVLRQLLESQHFFDADDASDADEIVGALIKSPLDLALQSISFFGLPIPDPAAENKRHYQDFYIGGVLGRMLLRAGMDLFYPPDVAGYPGYFQEPSLNRQFFNSASIVQRYKLPQMLLTGTYAWGPSASEPLGSQLDVAAWLRDSGVVSDPNNPAIVVQELLDYLAPETPDAERFDYFLNEIFLDLLPAADWSYEWQKFLDTGDDTEVKIPLGRLVNAVLYAPEYQVA